MIELIGSALAVRHLIHYRASEKENGYLMFLKGPIKLITMYVL